MGRILMFIVLLAAALTASAWMGIADSKADSGKGGRDASLNTAKAIRLNGGHSGGGRSDPAYDQAYSRQKYYRDTRSLVPIAKPLVAPGRNGRRTVQKGDGQDFTRFAAESRQAVGTLVVQPVGEMPGDQKRAIGHVLDAVSAFFGTPAVCASPIPAARLPRGYTRHMDGGRQINAEALMAGALRPNLGGQVASIIAVTPEDMYPGDSHPHDYAFVWSTPRDGTAVLSTARIFEASQADRGRNLLRLTKMTIHELCHTFGLKHCVQYSCLMNDSNDPAETDAAPLALCPDCLAKISFATGRDPALHLEDMLGLCKAKGFNADARHYLKALQMYR